MGLLPVRIDVPVLAALPVGSKKSSGGNVGRICRCSGGFQVVFGLQTGQISSSDTILIHRAPYVET